MRFYVIKNVFHTLEYLTSIKITQPVVPLFSTLMIALESMILRNSYIINSVLRLMKEYVSNIRLS